MWLLLVLWWYLIMRTSDKHRKTEKHHLLRNWDVHPKSLNSLQKAFYHIERTQWLNAVSEDPLVCHSDRNYVKKTSLCGSISRINRINYTNKPLYNVLSSTGRGLKGDDLCFMLYAEGRERRTGTVCFSSSLPIGILMGIEVELDSVSYEVQTPPPFKYAKCAL